MFPVIMKIGPVTIFSYGLLVAVAVLVCSLLMTRDARRLNIAAENIYDLVLWCVVGGIVGARIFYIGLNLSYFLAAPLEMVMIHKGGLAWQGGFLGGTLAGIIFVRRHNLSLGAMIDLVAPYLALGQSIGRIGCFLNGCCYGRAVKWGIYSPVQGAHLHPTQLYDTAALFMIFLILKYVSRKEHQPGQIFVWYLVLASLERFINEFFRGDHVSTYGGLSIFQWVSVGIFMAGLIIQAVIVRRKIPSGGKIVA